MLIEFQVENFGSIRERQVLSLAASKALKEFRATHTFPGAPDSSPGLSLLASGAIFGANASGKSTLVRALWRMGNFVLNSDQLSLDGVIPQGQVPPPRVPFKLAADWEARPSRFEITFIYHQVRYQYGFALGQQGIEEEYLLSYPKGRSQLLFQRGGGGWYLNRALGAKTRDLQERTRADVLFLSVAARWNHAVLAPIHEWFRDRLRWVDCSRPLPLPLPEALNDPQLRNQFLSFVQRADFGLVDLQTQVVPSKHFNIQVDTGKVEMQEGQAVKVDFLHKRSDGSGVVPFDFLEESGGTQKYLALASSWLDALHHGRTLVVDELETSLHPLLARKLIEVFHSTEMNPNRAQLVFATHLTPLLDLSLFRRDQIWFVEKNGEGASVLSPLTDFSPRNQEALQKGYLSGRYGAIPMLVEGIL